MDPNPMDGIYLDHAATTPVRTEVLEAMFPFFQRSFGNPSSVHTVGAEARVALEQARADVAAVLGSSPEEVLFTSGGTESDNLAIIGSAEGARHRGRHVVVSAIEHEAVLGCVRELERRGFRVSCAPVDAAGLLDPERVGSLVEQDTILVSCMYANNEVGTIEPLAEIVSAVKAAKADVLVHTDAVQAAGSLPLDVDSLGIDLLSLSAHKIYGPRGIGALYLRRGVPIEPLALGGGQEGGVRSGTENVPGAVGLAAALGLSDAERPAESRRLAGLRDHMIAVTLERCPGVRLTGDREKRLPGHVSFCLEDRSAESVLVDLDVRGIQCSSGSACHTGITDPSHVLLALGLPPNLARNGLRLTMGHCTTANQVDQACEALGDILGVREVMRGGGGVRAR